MHGTAGSQNVVGHVTRRAEAAGKCRDPMPGEFQHGGEHLFHFCKARVVFPCSGEPSDMDRVGLKQLPGGIDAIDSQIWKRATTRGAHGTDVVQMHLHYERGMKRTHITQTSAVGHVHGIAMGGAEMMPVRDHQFDAGCASGGDHGFAIG